MKLAERTKWQQKSLDELGFIGRGKSKHRPRNDPSLYGGEYPFIQTGEIKAADLYISRYSQTYNEKGLAQSKLWEPGTLCITIAANVAETAILKIRACFPDSIVGFIADPEKSDTHFVKYYLDTLKLQMQSISRGTTQDNLPVEKLLSFKLSVPPVSIQRKISAILSAYDNLIENNIRRIQILEEMAQRIYREWFVDFRFPGYEKTKFVNSELGKVPDGWKIRKVGEILQYYVGGGWGKEVMDEKHVVEAHVIRGTDIPEARRNNIRSCPLRYHTQSNFKSRKIETGDIVFEVSGGSKDQPVGRPLLINQRMLDAFGQAVICASFCKLMRVNRDIINPELFYLKLLSIYEDRSIYKYQVQSTGISNFKFEYFINNENVLCPTDILQERFEATAIPIFEQIALLGQKNMNLQDSRDRLLPKLISGEIDVSAMDIAVP